MFLFEDMLVRLSAITGTSPEDWRLEDCADMAIHWSGATLKIRPFSSEELRYFAESLSRHIRGLTKERQWILKEQMVRFREGLRFYCDFHFWMKEKYRKGPDDCLRNEEIAAYIVGYQPGMLFCEQNALTKKVPQPIRDAHKQVHSNYLKYMEWRCDSRNIFPLDLGR